MPEPARTLADLQPDDAGGALAADFDGHDRPPAPDLPDDRFSNRELSWLDFNARVLAQAEDRRLPLLERMKFLAIFASNLDEFYMVRVAGLKRRLDMGLGVRSPDGRTTRETLTQVVAADPGAGRPARRAACRTTSSRRWPTPGIRIAALGRARRGRAQPAAPSTSGPRSSRCSPRSRSTRRTRSRTSAGCRSTWPCWCATRRAGRRDRAVRPGQGAQQRGRGSWT